MGSPVLRWFDVRVLRDAGTTSPPTLQVPAANCMVDFYRQGATASETKTIAAYAADVAVNVYDSGSISAGDAVSAGFGGPALTVTAVTPTQVRVTNPSSAPVSIQVGDRFVPGVRPQAFRDPRRSQALGSQIQAAADGRATAYLAEARFDYVASGGGLANPRVFLDALGGTVPTASWVNALDYATLQDAVNALSREGGVVFLPAGRYPCSGITLTSRNVTLQGAGAGATLITTDDDQLTDPILRISGTNCTLRDLRIEPFKGQGVALALVGCSGCRLENVGVLRSRTHGLLMKNVASATLINTYCYAVGGSGLRIERDSATPFRIRIIGGQFSYNARGIEVVPAALNQGDSLLLLGCGIEGNGLPPPPPPPPPPSTEGAGLHVVDCMGVQVMACAFEQGSGPPVDQFVTAIRCKGIVIDGCSFNGTEKVQRAVRLDTSPWARLTNCLSYNTVSEMAAIDSGSTDVVEFCNLDLGIPPNPPARPRITLNSLRVFSLSRGGVQLFRHASQPGSLGLQNGALVWDDATHSLLLRKSGAWAAVNLDQP